MDGDSKAATTKMAKDEYSTPVNVVQILVAQYYSILSIVTVCRLRLPVH